MSPDKTPGDPGPAAEDPFTFTQQHPTGVTNITATVLAPVLIWLASLIPGVTVSPELALGLAALIISVPTLIASMRTPRITLPPIPAPPPAPPILLEEEPAGIPESVPPVKKTPAKRKTSTKRKAGTNPKSSTKPPGK